MFKVHCYPLFSRPAWFAFLAGIVLFAGSRKLTAQAASTSPAASSTTASPAQTAPAGTAATPVRRRTRRRYVAKAPAVPAQQQTVGLTPEQRRRDAQILAAQQAQSSETARQQAIVTGKVIKERQAQQDEPRIQDAPGPGAQTVPGNPATSTMPQSDPSSIQDAPGPAQTLPKTPAPTTTAPSTAPSPQS